MVRECGEWTLSIPIGIIHGCDTVVTALPGLHVLVATTLVIIGCGMTVMHVQAVDSIPRAPAMPAAAQPSEQPSVAVTVPSQMGVDVRVGIAVVVADI